MLKTNEKYNEIKSEFLHMRISSEKKRILGEIGNDNLSTGFDRLFNFFILDYNKALKTAKNLTDKQKQKIKAIKATL